MLLSIPGIPAGSEETTCCGQAKKQSSCCCCRVAGGLEDNTFSSVSLCCCSVSSCPERQAADVWKTQAYLHSDTHLPVGKLSFNKIRHCNSGHPSCHGKTRLWQHSRDLALSTALFFSSTVPFLFRSTSLKNSSRRLHNSGADPPVTEALMS